MTSAGGVVLALAGVALIVMAYKGTLSKVWNDIQGKPNTTTPQSSVTTDSTATNGATVETPLNPSVIA